MLVPNSAIIAAAVAESTGSPPQGWRRIGEGTQGIVYAKGAWVIKVFGSGGKWRDIDAPLDLLRRIWTGKIKPDNLPKVGYVSGRVAVMRKLAHMDGEKFDRWWWGPAGHKGLHNAIQRLEDEGFDVNDVSIDNVMLYRGKPILNDVV